MVIYYWELQSPDKLIFNMIKGGAGAVNINDLIHWSEGDLFTCFLPLMHEVKTVSSVLEILQQKLHIATVLFFPNSMLEPFISKPSRLERQIFLSHIKGNHYEKVNSNIYYILIRETGK